jgi:hypothetical protein
MGWKRAGEGNVTVYAWPLARQRKEAVALASYQAEGASCKPFRERIYSDMKHFVLSALGCALLAIGLCSAPVVSAAQVTAAAPTPVPVPHPDFSPMNFLLGSWTCTQPLRGKTRSETDVYTMSSDGMWMVDAATSPPFDEYRTVAQNGMTYMTYDPTVNQWVTVNHDNLGGYGIESTSGWQGNTASWSGKGIDGSTFADVITKVSATETSDASTTTDPKGQVTNVTITCKKDAS